MNFFAESLHAWLWHPIHHRAGSGQAVDDGSRLAPHAV